MGVHSFYIVVETWVSIAFFSANKLTRISWVIVTTGEPFDMKQAFKPAA